MSAQTHLPPFWRQRLLVLVGGHADADGPLRLLDALERAEGGTARFNPLNTTFPLPGAWLYNTAGVRNYLHAVDGIAATGCTLANGLYPHLLGYLQSTRIAPNWQTVDPEISRWGTDAALVHDLFLKGA